jgi:hypothetical protein
MFFGRFRETKAAPYPAAGWQRALSDYGEFATES